MIACKSLAFTRLQISHPQNLNRRTSFARLEREREYEIRLKALTPNLKVDSVYSSYNLEDVP